jgi:hypothetical protein
LKSEERGDWEVVLEIEGEEGPGPRLIDLCHRPKWLVQASSLGTIPPWGLEAPEKPGQVSHQSGFLVNRMGATQAAVWHLGSGAPAGDVAEETCLTDVTDGQLLLAVVGSHVFSVADKLTTLDLAEPDRKAPFLLQGPFCHVPASVVVMRNHGGEGSFLLACSRGYGHDVVRALMHAGESFGIGPAGESVLERWLP